MPSRFYFFLNEVSAVTPTVRGTWDDTTERLNRRMHTVKELSTITVGQVVDSAATGNHRDLDRVYLSDPMESGIAFVTTDTVTGQLMVREYAGTDNVDSIHMGLFVVSQDGATLRATLLATNDYMTRAEFVNNATHRNKTIANGDVLGANYTTVSGDRLQLELGYRVASGGGTSPQASAKWGDNATDLPINETQTTDGAGWFELSRAVTFLVTATFPGWYGVRGWF